MKIMGRGRTRHNIDEGEGGRTVRERRHRQSSKAVFVERNRMKNKLVKSQTNLSTSNGYVGNNRLTLSVFDLIK